VDRWRSETGVGNVVMLMVAMETMMKIARTKETF